MYELTINGKVYGFRFGFGFYKDIDKQIKSKADANGVSRNVGLQYKLAEVVDGDPMAIVDVLDVANKYSGTDRLTRAELEEYIEETDDLDTIKEGLLDFFRANNTTKGTMRTLDVLVQMTPEQKAKIMQNQ